MTVKELITKYRFDELIPYIEAIRVREKESMAKIYHDYVSIANYREMYDYIIHTTPDMSRIKYDESRAIEGDKREDWEEGREELFFCWPPHLRGLKRIPIKEGAKLADVCWETRYCDSGPYGEPYADVHYADNIRWEYHIGRELLYHGEGFDEKEVAASVLYNMTGEYSDGRHYLRTPGELYVDWEDRPKNKYDKRLFWYSGKHYENYKPKKKYLDKWSEDEINLYVKRHSQRRNRIKRMRDRRYLRKYHLMLRLSYREKNILRIIKQNPAIPYKDLEWMLKSQEISEERFCSRAYDVARRMDYLWESLTVYTDPQKEPYPKSVIVFRTSPEYPLTDDERKVLDHIAALYGDQSQVTLYIGTDPSLGVEADLYIVRVR